VILAPTVPADENVPAVIRFVAPAYPRAAKDSRIYGKTITVIVVGRDGVVTQAQTVVAHPVFEQQVLEALKQWRFARSDQEHRFQVTC
jgi:TonB family protein